MKRELRYARKIDLNAIGSLNKSGLICCDIAVSE
jgi:hypothetical protein